MSFSDERGGRGGFRSPLFIISAVIIGLIVIAGIALSIYAALQNDDEPDARPTQTASSAPSSTPSTTKGVDEGDSRCDLPGEVLVGTVDSAPEYTWAYLGPITFPSSELAGPGQTLESGALVCYAQTPEGAVFAASAGIAQLSAPEVAPAFIESNVVDGEVKDQMLEGAAQPRPADGETRLTISGFKLLAYDGETASVDVAVTAVRDGRTVYLSSIVPLRWADGDWMFDFTPEQALAPAQLPNLAGYIVWG